MEIKVHLWTQQRKTGQHTILKRPHIAIWIGIYLPHCFQPSYSSYYSHEKLGTETQVFGFQQQLWPYTIRAQVTHQNVYCTSKSQSNTQCILPVPICAFLKVSYLGTFFQRLTMWQKYADSIICEGKYQREGTHEVWPLEIMLPSGIHVKSVRAEVFCLNPISIRFQYQSSLWLLILHRTISNSLICLPGPLLAVFPSLHLPSSLALITHCLRETAGNQILNPLWKCNIFKLSF